MSDGGAFSSGFANAYRMMMDREEKKRKQDANLALTNAYLEMEEQRRQSQIAPQKQAFDAATGNAVDAQMRQNSSAIANSAGQQNLMTPEIKEALAQSGIPVGEIPANVNPALTQTAGGQPVTPDMQQAFGSSAMTGLQSANTQANQAQQLLAEAEKRYPPSVLAKMAPLVSKGVPFEKLYAFAESENAKEINRTKTAELNKAYKEVFSNKDLTDEQRAIMLLSVNPSDPIGKMFAERSGKKDLGFTLGQGQTRYDSQGRPIASVAPKPEKPAAGTWILQTNPDGSQVKVNTITGQEIKVSPAKETFIETPLGKFSNSQLLARLEAVRPKTIETVDDFGKKITKREGDIEVYNILNKALKDHVAKQQPATTSQQSPTLQGIVDNIQKNKETKTFDDAIKEIDKNQSALIAQGVDPEKLKIYTHQIYGVPLQ